MKQRFVHLWRFVMLSSRCLRRENHVKARTPDVIGIVLMCVSSQIVNQRLQEFG